MDPYHFTEDWAKACQIEINASEEYRAAAETWEGAFVFAVDGGAAERGVFVDLWHGECRQARALAAGDADLAPFVIRGEEHAWDGVLSGNLEPLTALIMGRLKLAKGSLGTLAFHIRSARELVACAARVSQRPNGGAPA
jgi:putative sterol carrier protein